MLNIYNVNQDIFLIGHFGFYFDETGHIERYERLSAVRLMASPYYSSTSLHRAILAAFILFTIGFFLVEVVELFKSPSLYFYDMWNIYEVVHLICIGMSLEHNYAFIDLSEDVANQIKSGDQGAADEGFRGLT